MPRGALPARRSQAALDDEEMEPIQLGKRTLEAIVDGVVVKLQESTPAKSTKDGSTSPAKAEVSIQQTIAKAQ